MNKIEIKNLYFSYDKNQKVLEDINMKISEKEIVTIIGPNGGGKTTLLKLISGILKPKSGEILINGKKSNNSSKYIGYVPQYVNYDRKFPITVFEIVLSGKIKNIGFYNKKDRELANKNLEKAGLQEYKNEPFYNLSGGQMQRALIARALTTEADILLLDEPTANIDSKTEKDLNSLLKNLSKQITIVLVTHDTGFVSNITDRVFCINKGSKEHPIDKNFSDLIKSAYSNQSFIVRHEKEISNRGENNE